MKHFDMPITINKFFWEILFDSVIPFLQIDEKKTDYEN